MGDLFLELNGVSRHAEPMQEAQPGRIKRKHGGYLHEPVPETPYNEQNPGLGVRYEWGDPADLAKFVMAGGYRNSFNRDTYYAGGGLLKRFAGGDDYNLNAGITAGVATGYNDSVVPMVLPTLSAGIKNTRLNLMYGPPIDGSPETLMLSASFKLGADKERAARIKEHTLKTKD